MDKQQNPEIPQLRRHRATGRGRVILSGHHHYLKAPFGTPECYREYLQLIEQWERNGRRSPHQKGPLHFAGESIIKTVGELFDAYESCLDDTRKYQKRGEETTQRDAIRRALKELREHNSERTGRLSLAKFSKAELVLYRDALQTRPGLSPGGVNRKINLIRQAFAWGTERGFISESAMVSMERLKPLPSKNQKVAHIPDEHLRAILPHLPFGIRVMAVLQRLAGMRPGEVRRIRWVDIDQHPNGKAGELGMWTYTVEDPKTGAPTEYLLNRDAQRLLGQFVKPPAAFIFTPADEIARGRPRRGKPVNAKYSKDLYRRTFQAACRNAGVPNYSPNQIRHSNLQWVGDHPELGLPAASAVANHRSQSSTERYVHTNPELAVRAAELVHMDEVLGASPEDFLRGGEQAGTA